MSSEKKYIVKTVGEIRSSLRSVLRDKYFNLFMSMYDTDLDPIVYHYLFRRFWETGTVAGFKVKNTEDIGISPYVVKTYNTYDYPEIIQLVNVRNSPIIPAGPKIVNKDAVIGFCQSNHGGIKKTVEKYIDRIVDVDMVINTQLVTHKLPFLVGVTPEDEKKANDIITRIMNDEPVVFLSLNDINLIKTLVNGNQFIVDKLETHKQSIECELLTFLGLDNAVSQNVNLDITNANNSMINAFKHDIDTNIQNFVNDCSTYLGIDFSLKMRQNDVKSVYEEENPTLENNTGRNIKEVI